MVLGGFFPKFGLGSTPSLWSGQREAFRGEKKFRCQTYTIYITGVTGPRFGGKTPARGIHALFGLKMRSGIETIKATINKAPPGSSQPVGRWGSVFTWILFINCVGLTPLRIKRSAEAHISQGSFRGSSTSGSSVPHFSLRSHQWSSPGFR